MSASLPECGVARFLVLLDGPWATLIVRELCAGPRRFSQLRGTLPGISPHTLTRRLRRFETYGVVSRRAFAETPPRVEYSLTARGERLKPVLEAMAEWALAVPEPEIPDPSPGEDIARRSPSAKARITA